MKSNKISSAFRQIQTWFLQPDGKEPKLTTKTERMAALGSALFVVLLILEKLIIVSNTVFGVLMLLVVLLELPELIKMIRSVREGKRKQ